MKRIVATLLAFLFATAAHAQSGLLPANQVWAGPPSGGQGFARARALVAADLPALSPGGLSLASGQIMVGQVSGFAGAVAMSGDCTIVASGAITCPKANGVAFGALATATPGTGVAAAIGVNVGSAGAFVVNGGALGTPSSGTLTNATGLPLASVTGLGAGVATALGTAVGSAGAPLVNGGVLGTPSSGVGTNLTALNATQLTSGTIPNARITALPNANLANSAITLSGQSVALGGSYAPARAVVASGSPGVGTAAGPVMGGASVSVTPTASGNILVVASYGASNSVGGDGCSLQLAYGTGTAPAHNAAPVGTTTGRQGSVSGFGAAGFNDSVPLNMYITGLTVSTTYWIDVQYSAVTGGTCTITNYSIQAIEE